MGDRTEHNAPVVYPLVLNDTTFLVLINTHLKLILSTGYVCKTSAQFWGCDSVQTCAHCLCLTVCYRQTTIGYSFGVQSTVWRKLKSLLFFIQNLSVLLASIDFVGIPSQPWRSVVADGRQLLCDNTCEIALSSPSLYLKIRSTLNSQSLVTMKIVFSYHKNSQN